MTLWQELTETTLKDWVSRPRLGIITDVDGTISPIADSPEAAQVTERSRQLLRDLLSHVTLLAAVSGRSAEDIHQRVGVEGMIYVGNHGLERWQDGVVVSPPEVQQYRPAIEAAYEELQARAKHIPGLLVEDKTATLSVHYRSTSHPASIAISLRPVIQSITAIHNLRLYEGRMVFELRPPLDLNKGTAFSSLVEEFRLDAAIYMGDDVTDVDAMDAAHDLRDAGSSYTLALGVLSSDTPALVREAADFFAEEVAGVEDFLAWVLMSRTASSS